MRSAAKGFYLAVFALLGPAHATNDPAGKWKPTASDTCAVGSVTAFPPSHPLTLNQIDPKAIVSDACASYSTLDSLNNALSPSLKAITQSTDFFAYYRLNLFDKTCPVRAWDDETGTCGNIACKVDTLEDEKDIPLVWRAKELSKLEGPKAAHPGRLLQRERGSQKPLQGTLGDNVGESCVVEYDDECDDRDYCVPEDESATAKGDYVSLVDNPERFTGYAGANVWDAIYRENCFSKEISATTLTGNTQPLGTFQAANDLRTVIQAGAPSFDLSLDECLEKRVFHRVISGMHASITTHICNDYLNQTTGNWGPNLQCYQDRLATHPERISNLYFNYALLLRAVTKLRTYLKHYTFCSGDAVQDSSTRTAVLALADAAAKQPRIFDEDTMFQDPHDTQLKEDFRNRFRNVSSLMDCVGCDKCRLWGKLQTVGYGTALKVLFEYDEMKNGENPPLRRTELVALVNTLDRVSNSLTALGRLRDMTLPQQSFPIPETTTTKSAAPLYDEDEDDLSQIYPDDSEEESLYDSIMAELTLVWRTYVYVLKSWIELPGKVGRIFAIEASRLWAFWLGMPIARREWEVSRPGREDL